MLATVNHLSDLTGLDRRTVTKRLAATPALMDGDSRKWDTRAALPVLYGILGSDEEKLDPQQERARLDKARRETVEKENRKRAAELLEASDVAARWAHVGTMIKGRMLAIPSQMAPRLAGMHAEKDIHEALRLAITAALAELSDNVKGD